MTSTQYDSTSMTSYKRHITAKHVVMKDNKEILKPGQQTLKEAFEKAEKKTSLDGLEVDLSADTLGSEPEGEE